MITIKTLAIIFTLSIMTNIGLSGQDYTPFYVNNAEWTIETIYPTLGPGDGGAVWQYKTKNDTVVNDTMYTNLTKRNLCEYWPMIVTGSRVYVQNLDRNEYIIGGIREENRRVYFYDYSTQEEKLIYRYDFEIGDTIHFNANNFTIVLEELPKYLDIRRYKVRNRNAYSYPYETSTLFEGFGSSYGLFGSYQGYFNFLNCFRLDDDILYGGCSYCEGFITDLSYSDNEVINTIYPNPAKNIIYIENNQKDIARVRLLDLNGVTVKQYESLGEDKISLDISLLHSGVFIVEIIYLDHTCSHKKIVKSN